MIGFNRLRIKSQRGFTLVELIIAISISALLAVYAQTQIAHQSEEDLAIASAAYLANVTNSAQQMVLDNFNLYTAAAGPTVPGFSNSLAPTLAELRAGPKYYLYASFPDSMPTKQTVAVTITQTACPGSSCTMNVLACTTTAITLGGNPLTSPIRFDLASTMMAAQGSIAVQNSFSSSGVQSVQGGGGNILTGPLVTSTANMANPYPGVEGIVCGYAAVNTSLYNKFVQMGDSRDPNLQGNLTIGGTTELKGSVKMDAGANVTGTLTADNLNVGPLAAPCVKINGTTGNGGFGCVNDFPAGYTGVRSPDVISNRNILASDSPSAFSGSNGNYSIVTANNGSGAAEIRTSGDVKATGRAVADRLTPTGSYAAGTACSSADEGSIAKVQTGVGLVVCQSSVWTSLSVTGAAGAACTIDGQMSKGANGVGLLCLNGAYQSMADIVKYGSQGTACPVTGGTAIDLANNNQVLVCRSNLTGGSARYMRLMDVTTQLAFSTAVEVSDQSVVTKPICQDAIGQVATPVIQLIPKVFNSPNGGYSFFAVDNGGSPGSWTANLKTGTGVAMTGSVAIAQVFCYFN